PLTAERLIIAALDEIAGCSYENTTEFRMTREMLGKFFPEPLKAKEALLAYISDNRGTTFLDDLYMKKRLKDAEDMAKGKETEIIDVPSLLSCIFTEPSDAIRKLLPNGRPSLPLPETKNPGSKSLFDRLAEMKGEKKTAPQTEETEAQRQDDKTDKNLSALVEEVKEVRRQLESVIFGQENAIQTFVTGYFQARLLSMIDKSKRRPGATFLFAGPPGVGKTFLAEQAAEALQLPFKRFDMSEYADHEANLEFCGTDQVYKNAKAGNVTGFVEKNPRCVLLFDEIEKAHICVIHLFLQLLDAGRLRDNFTDTEISFKDAILIFTTNAGKQLYMESEDGDLSSVSRKVIMKALEKDVNPETGVPYFPGAICSRFASGNVVMFNHIGAHNLRSIAKKEILRHAGNLEKEMGMTMDIDESVYTALLFAEGGAADARTVRSRAESFFNDELYELLRLVGSGKTEASIDSLKRIRVVPELGDCNKEIRELFVPGEKMSILVFANEETVERCRALLPRFCVMGAATVEKAVSLLREKEVAFVMIDALCGLSQDGFNSLNIEDIDSLAREFFKFLREKNKQMPVYLLETKGDALDEEEQVSLLRQGYRGKLCLMDRNFGDSVQAVAAALYQQEGMVKLARGNKVISFETAQTVSADGIEATIRLFDFDMAVAVDSEDAKNVLSAVSMPNIRFEDVIGARDAKEELRDFVRYLREPRKYLGTGVKAPKGIILHGPPGTGKTMLAKAMACEAGVTFIAAEGNQFLKKYVGEGPEAVHQLFKTARKYAPSILFVDEIDAIAKERRGGEGQTPGAEATLTAFLTEMDGFVNDPSKPVFVLAATNFDVEPGGSKSLDPALMRRFDRRVYIDLPDKEARIKFLMRKIEKNPALRISEKQIENIALRSTGMSLANLDSAVELALRSAIRAGGTFVSDAILEEAFETFVSGEEKKWDISQLRRVAIHESGHALMCWLGGETPSYLTIVARGNHGGYMQHADREGKAIYTREELLARIRTSLGGRGAEIVYYGLEDGISTGASGDLASATDLARRLLCNYGMDDAFGLAVVDSRDMANG
ncbi:MAG: AAA family ATPase, partial [Oscillospiraceae bacterium]|nr:AAA family ATPase [Oscillospiraceae bacterium]